MCCSTRSHITYCQTHRLCSSVPHCQNLLTSGNHSKTEHFSLPVHLHMLLPKKMPMQVAERGLKFVQSFTELLAQQHQAANLPALFCEAWAFSACISLATTTSRLVGLPIELNSKPQGHPASPGKTASAYRYAVEMPPHRCMCAPVVYLPGQSLTLFPNARCVLTT